MLNSLRFKARPFTSRLRTRLLDTLENRRWVVAGDPHFLVLRHWRDPRMYETLLRWMEINFPEVRSCFYRRTWPVRLIDLENASIVIPWLQDPVPNWSIDVHAGLCSFADSAYAHDIPVFNHPASQLNAARRTTSELLSGLDIRVPKVMLIESEQDLLRIWNEFSGPVILRSHWGHGGTFLKLERGELPDWRFVSTLTNAAAIEYIDTSDEQGLFTKFRYLAAGTRGISAHRITSVAWEVRGSNKLLHDKQLADEQHYMEYLDVNHKIFQKARVALGLDLVAFDYSYDREGRIVIWEGNPNPGISFGSHAERLRYRHAAFHRCFAAMTCAYFDKAGLEAPKRLAALCDYSGELSDRLLKRLQLC